MIWTLTTMLKYPCSAFFPNYVEHINDIRDTLFLWFERLRIQKKIISCTSFMRYHLKIQAQNKKNYDSDTFSMVIISKNPKKIFVTHYAICTNQFFFLLRNYNRVLLHQLPRINHSRN